MEPGLRPGAGWPQGFLASDFEKSPPTLNSPKAFLPADELRRMGILVFLNFRGRGFLCILLNTYVPGLKLACAAFHSSHRLCLWIMLLIFSISQALCEINENSLMPHQGNEGGTTIYPVSFRGSWGTKRLHKLPRATQQKGDSNPADCCHLPTWWGS